mgnify:CR=1 FL=1
MHAAMIADPCMHSPCAGPYAVWLVVWLVSGAFFLRCVHGARPRLVVVGVLVNTPCAGWLSPRGLSVCPPLLCTAWWVYPYEFCGWVWVARGVSCVHGLCMRGVVGCLVNYVVGCVLAWPSATSCCGCLCLCRLFWVWLFFLCGRFSSLFFSFCFVFCLFAACCLLLVACCLLRACCLLLVCTSSSVWDSRQERDGWKQSKKPNATTK